MPILAAPPAAQPGLVIEDVGYVVATWYAPDGSVWPLMNEDLGWHTLADGVAGLDAAAITITTDKRMRGGVRVRHIRPEQRAITWPLDVYSAESHTQFVARWRELMLAFTQTSRLGPGWLEIARPDGTARQAAAYYQAGFEGRHGMGVLSDQAAITLLCEDPYWSDRDPVVIDRAYATGVPFLVPFPTVSSAHVLGDTTIVNPGDVEAWPTWTITGPASGLTATLHTTGEAFTLDPALTAHGPLAAGETATIRTNPAQVRGPADAVWTGALDWPGAVLWSLPPGEHPVTFAVAGAGPGSAVRLEFFPRYESA
ncbi:MULTISPECIES: phage tail protein [Actinomadura]|uniref:Phage tail protein n=1 Tax=Actinomadura yumaensis TaxID=111807 RepID=A0ABW2CU62_9ACTN|nr:phage tail protein [Actinomadura sp. J1-007]MWK39567.1 phage tail protein [Actinomadura sp. J1-007]